MSAPDKAPGGPQRRSVAVTIYSIEVCPFAQRTRMLLALKGIPFDLVEIDITKPRPDWFLELNPLGKVPVIVHQGMVLNESSIINEYLEDVYPTPPAFPTDPYLKAQARILIDYCNSRFTTNMYRVLMEQDPARRARVEQAAKQDWAWLDEFLTRLAPEGDLVFGEFGMVDLTYAPFFERYVLNAYFWGFEIPADLERMNRWRNAALAHPLVGETGMAAEDYIKLYADYSLGYANGAVPPGQERSSADMSVPLTGRSMPPRRI
jgi:glutathione S-transferase